jgi:dTDP-4-dehydrorhamnose 3,5-epimerase
MDCKAFALPFKIQHSTFKIHYPSSHAHRRSQSAATKLLPFNIQNPKFKITSMTIHPLPIAGLLRIEPKKFTDHRGFFSETFRESALAAAGFHKHFVQDNHSLSTAAGTLRGLHFQKPPHAQAKLIRVLRGRILDVAVDLRCGSPDFGRHVAVELSAENDHQLLVPEGFAHGFITLEPDTEVYYKVTAYYAPESDSGISWNDPDLAIDWQWPGTPVTSEKDAELPPLSKLPAGLFPFGP